MKDGKGRKGVAEKLSYRISSYVKRTKDEMKEMEILKSVQGLISSNPPPSGKGYLAYGEARYIR